jgi:[protein]-arginine 3-hydroxylase / protease
MKGLAQNWPAVQNIDKKWSNIMKLRDRLTEFKVDYLVRVEFGNQYMDNNVQVKEVSFLSFLDYIIQSQTITNLDSFPRVYLAQQDLQDLPMLLEDLEIPLICLQTGYQQVYRTNLWLSGSLGSESPCHYDLYDNLLVQIVGTKRVLLFSPSQSDSLYPAITTFQKNTSLVNIVQPNYILHPKAKELMGVEANLEEGDAIYIPKKWWHFIQSSTTACSVNYWWT